MKSKEEREKERKRINDEIVFAIKNKTPLPSRIVPNESFRNVKKTEKDKKAIEELYTEKEPKKPEAEKAPVFQLYVNSGSDDGTS